MKQLAIFASKLIVIALINTIALYSCYSQDLPDSTKKEIIVRLQMLDSLEDVYIMQKQVIDSLVVLKENLKGQVNDLKLIISQKESIISSLNAQKFKCNEYTEVLKQEIRRKSSPFSVGVSTGFAMTNTSFAPYVGIGLQIDVWRISF